MNSKGLRGMLVNYGEAQCIEFHSALTSDSIMLSLHHHRNHRTMTMMRERLVSRRRRRRKRRRSKRSWANSNIPLTTTLKTQRSVVPYSSSLKLVFDILTFRGFKQNVLRYLKTCQFFCRTDGFSNCHFWTLH